MGCGRCYCTTAQLSKAVRCCRTLTHALICARSSNTTALISSWNYQIKPPKRQGRWGPRAARALPGCPAHSSGSGPQSAPGPAGALQTPRMRRAGPSRNTTVSKTPNQSITQLNSFTGCLRRCFYKPTISWTKWNQYFHSDWQKQSERGMRFSCNPRAGRGERDF